MQQLLECNLDNAIALRCEKNSHSHFPGCIHSILGARIKPKSISMQKFVQLQRGGDHKNAKNVQLNQTN